LKKQRRKDMPKFTVERKEVWVHSVTVEANSPQEAVSILAEHDVDDERVVEDLGTEYDYILDVDKWNVRDEQGCFYSPV